MKIRGLNMAKKRKRDYSYSENSPFVVRKPMLRLWQMMFFGFAMTVTIFASIYFGGQNVRDFVVMLFGVIIIILFYFIQNSYFDEKTATEFQCSVYAGAMRSNTMMSFILHHDCGIYYFDQRYLNEFSNASSFHNFEHIMDNLQVNNDMRKKIATAVQDSKYFEFEHKMQEGTKRGSLLIGVYPISRPNGFSYLSIYRIKD